MLSLSAADSAVLPSVLRLYLEVPSVTILEQKPALGGRAYSFRDGVTGDTIDNGQHVLIAGYERTLHFLETIGTRDLLHIQSSLTAAIPSSTEGLSGASASVVACTVQLPCWRSFQFTLLIS